MESNTEVVDTPQEERIRRTMKKLLSPLQREQVCRECDAHFGQEHAWPYEDCETCSVNETPPWVDDGEEAPDESPPRRRNQ